MSIELDKSYINMLSGMLDKFTWEQDNICRFRCPICLDSKKKANKRRGHFYADHDIDRMRFKCHNCGEASGWDLGLWLKTYEPTLYQSYVVDSFQETKRNSGSYMALKKKEEPKKAANKDTRRTRSLVKKKQEVQSDYALDTYCIPVSELGPGHMCYDYLVNRQVPKRFFDILFFTNNYQRFAIGMNPENMLSAEKCPKDPRLVIPFFNARGEMIMAQGRSFDPKCDLRYISIKKEEKTTKCYGLERIDFDRTKLVVEGPIDSLFLPNCMASADADLLKVKGDIYIPDNQPRNREIVNRIEKMIKAGVKVCLLPHSLEQYGKDINEYIMNGVSTPELLRHIANNTFQGLKAEFEFAKWRKI
ncbi:DNA primase [Vibrio phage VAP7]|uniref:DNA primase n=1 Tax=Vibrio phage VAP7 TaxID=2584487 RepID=A0A4Y5TW73_9CAUD|nr:DNA primase [Vibrio phage VAP7]QDB73285.1 DNA primase [Vibrio phage VAP7]